MATTAHVTISLKPGVLDPEGKAIRHALAVLGFSGVEDARVGKVITLTLAEDDPAKARAAVEEMAHKLLANPVIENWTIAIDGEKGD